MNTINKYVYMLCFHVTTPMNDTDRNVLRVIASETDESGRGAVISITAIAEEIGRCRKTVHRSLERLQSIGLIHRNKNKETNFVTKWDIEILPDYLEAITGVQVNAGDMS